MKQKDLAREYALARLQGRPSGNEISFCENKVFTEGDIETAFNAGRESVVENMPELEWREKICRDEYFLEACPFGAYYLIKIDYGFHVAINYKHFVSCTSLATAKQAANDDYKKRIKQTLGI